MKIDDLKANARLVLKGPLAITGFKVGEVSIVDAVGTESVLFKGMGISVKRDVVFERFVTEPEWKIMQDHLNNDTKRSVGIKEIEDIVSKHIGVLSDDIKSLIDVLQKLPALHVSDVAGANNAKLAKKAKKPVEFVISPGQPSINGMLILHDAGKPLTEQQWREGFKKSFGANNSGCAVTWHYMKHQKLICEVYMPNINEPYYKVSPLGLKINSPGRYAVDSKNEIKLIQAGETGGKKYIRKRDSLKTN
jgi:hypothetical protein